MVIGVDAGALSITDDRLKVGVYRVTKNAIEALAKIDRENNYRLYTFDAIEEGITQGFGGRAEVVQLPRRGWQRVWLPIELKRRPVSAFFGFAQALPFFITSYNIGFIYDLGFVYQPEVYGAAARTLKKQTDDLVRRADHIITISHAAMADIVHEYAVPRDRVTVAYPGVGPEFSPAGEKFIGPNPYVLFVGSLNTAKDIPTLIEAFAEFLKDKKMDSGSRAGMTNLLYDLYLIGGDYWPDPKIEEVTRKHHLEHRVKKIGYVSDEELPKYYRGAIAFVTTALREGFCLPAAEAMACGTPVVALDRGALREVVGEGGIIISEKRKAKSEKLRFVEAMNTMRDKRTRTTYSKKALMQAKKFRWEEFAEHIRSFLALRKERP